MTYEIPWAPALAEAGAGSAGLGAQVSNRAVEERARRDLALAVLFAELELATDGAERQRLLGALYDSIATDLHGIALWRTGCRADAADVVQTVFVRLAEGRVRFGRVRRPRLLLLAMAHRAAIDLVRRRRHTVQIEDVSIEVAPLLVEPASVSRSAEAAEVSRWLCDLPAAQREALYLRYFDGLGFREIGTVVGVPTFTAASRCRLGLAALRRRARGRGVERVRGLRGGLDDV
jgi:RNA polymerase sigma-70 factor (ECF subfamily)